MKKRSGIIAALAAACAALLGIAAFLSAFQASEEEDVWSGGSAWPETGE